MTKESSKDDSGHEKLINNHDSHFVFIRPKSIVGSSGTVWASELVRLWHNNPKVFEIDEVVSKNPSYSDEFSSVCAVLHDFSFQYQDMTVEEDIGKLTGDLSAEQISAVLSYEKMRIDRVINALKQVKDQRIKEQIKFEQHEEIIFETRLSPLIDEIVNKAENSTECDAKQTKNLSIELRSSCDKLIDMLNELQLPQVRPRIAYLTDAGPGVGVSNFEVRFRDAELARMWNSDYRVRVHRSRGDSGQGEAERTNSAIGDSVVDGATIEWEVYKRYEGMSQDEIQKMSLSEFEKYERDRMCRNAWEVAKELVNRIDGAPVLGEYINCQLSEQPKKLFFFNKEGLEAHQHGTAEKKKTIPGSGYIQKITQFMDSHYEYGQLFMEYIKFACKKEGEACDFCSIHDWVGPPADRVPQPVPDIENPGHFLNVFKTPNKDRFPDDWQPRACLAALYKEGNISLNEHETIEKTAKKLNIEICHAVSCLEHLRSLDIGKSRRVGDKDTKRQQRNDMKYEDYDWMQLVISGKISKLYVFELDRYLDKFKLNKKCKKADKIKSITVNVLRNMPVEEHQLKNYENDEKSDSDGADEETDSEFDDDESDLVFHDLDEEEINADEADVPLIRRNRYGRLVGTWRLAYS